MPYYDAPQSDAGRLAYLKTSVNTAEQDLVGGTAYLSQETVDKVKTFTTEFEAAYQTVSNKLGVRVKETAESNKALESLKLYIRDLWEVTRRRARRLNQNVAVLTYYGLPIDGISPNPTTRQEWLVLAEKIIKGDAEAITKGFPPAQNPSAAEVQTQFEAAKQEMTEVAQAERAYDESQEVLSKLRLQADDLINDITAELRFYLRKKDPASQRRVMGAHGATFRNLPGEAVEGEGATA